MRSRNKAVRAGRVGQDAVVQCFRPVHLARVGRVPLPSAVGQGDDAKGRGRPANAITSSAERARQQQGIAAGHRTARGRWWVASRQGGGGGGGGGVPDDVTETLARLCPACAKNLQPTTKPSNAMTSPEESARQQKSRAAGGCRIEKLCQVAGGLLRPHFLKRGGEAIHQCPRAGSRQEGCDRVVR